MLFSKHGEVIHILGNMTGFVGHFYGESGSPAEELAEEELPFQVLRRALASGQLMLQSLPMSGEVT